MKLQDLQNQIHAIAKDHGWHDDTIRDAAGIPTVTQFIAWMGLVHSEIVEADNEVAHYYNKEGKPEGKVVELADVKIRLLDVAGALGFEICLFINTKPAQYSTVQSLHGIIAEMTERSRVGGPLSESVRLSLYVAVEAVDRVASLIGYNEGLFEQIVLEKCEYNRNREYKHGKLA